MSNLEELFEKLKSQASNNEEKDQLYEHMLSLYETQSNQDNKNIIIETIVDDFVYSNMVFYNKTSKLYFNYINNHYVVLNEDNMIHHVLEFITNFKEYRNDMNLSLKQIKNNVFLNISRKIPSMKTYRIRIRSNLFCRYWFPPFFGERNMPKYF